MRKKRCIFCGSLNTKKHGTRSNWNRHQKYQLGMFFSKALIVDSDVMWITPKELPPLLGQPFRLPTLSTILLLFFNFKKELIEQIATKIVYAAKHFI